MNIGIAQINTIVGDLKGNKELILSNYHSLVEQGAELVVFPELTISGYPPLDLLFKRSFVSECESVALEIAQVSTIPILFGCPVHNPDNYGKPLHNAAYFCANGEVLKIAHKRLLPTYDVFDEKRYFEPGKTAEFVEWKGKTIALTICEDIWIDAHSNNGYKIDPLQQLEHHKPDFLINLSGSPWHVQKTNTRLRFLKNAACRLNCPAVYCNLVGGNDELIFDGSSKVMSKTGELKVSMKSFDNDAQLVNLNELDSRPTLERQENDLERIHRALVLGVRDYAHKTGFKTAVIGLSGGIDSAVTAAIAVDALGKENVTGISLPSSISSQHSRDDAADLAKKLGINYHSLPIADVVSSVESTLTPLFKDTQVDVTEENIQARSRGILLMAMSNKFGSLLLTTGNKSEMAVGYCTLYGDMAGGLAVICDVLKTIVFDLARYLNREREIIPESTITKPPSAELRPDQKDEDSLPPYPVLDAILKLYIEQGMTRADIIAQGYEAELVHEIVRKVDLNEYKRKQAPPGLKISTLAFGIGRRIPIVQKYVG